MSKLSDNYPPGMDDCSANGMSGNCGVGCQKLLRGECDAARNFDRYISFEDGDYMFIIIRDTLKCFELE